MLRHLILLITLFPAILPAQSAPPGKRSGSKIERARALRAENPEEAVRLLDELIRDKAPPRELAEAFFILGDLYLDIGQPELALGRYDQAAELLPATGELAGRLALQRGQAEFAAGAYDRARTQYERCLDLVSDESPTGGACREGLADVDARQGFLAVSQSNYTIAKKATPDSLAQSRINAKQANVYLQQNDLGNAVNSYNQAIEQVPRGQRLNEADVNELVTAGSRVRGTISREAPELDNQVVNLLPTAPPELLVADELNRFRALRDLGDTRQAAVRLKKTLAAVDTTTAAAVAADVYAESADFYLRRDEVQEAAAAYRQLAAANERLLTEQRAAVEREVAILRGQQSVDLGLKDYRAAVVEDGLRRRQSELRLWLNYLLGALLLVALLSVFIVLRNVRRRRRANQELLLRNLQTRMNPHFIFNSLNSINNYIARQDERAANRYLGRFAKLMRRVLDQSGKDFVSLAEELEQLELYLELEKERFGERFNYQIEVAEDLAASPENLELPPMILQPFVENAIWHGLRYRPAGGQLSITVGRQAGRPVVTITDNGIGREKSEALKTSNQRRHRSSGVATSRRRLALINEHYGRGYELEITDAFNNEAYPGTRVNIWLDD